MALTDVGNAYFLQWQSQSGVQGRQVQGIYGLVSRLPNADEVAQRAATENWTPAFLLEYSTKLLQQGAQPTGPAMVASKTEAMNAAKARFFAANPVEQGPQVAPGSQMEPTYQPQLLPTSQPIDGSNSRANQRRAERAAQEAKKSGKGGGSFLGRLNPFAKKTDAPAPSTSPAFAAQRGFMPNGAPMGAQFGARPGSAASAATAKPAGKKGGISTIALVGMILGGLVILGIVATALGSSIGGGNRTFVPKIEAPEAPDSAPLNLFGNSQHNGGFLDGGAVLALVIGIGSLLLLVGDILYRDQWGDGIVAIVFSAMSIFMLFPKGTAIWIGVVFFLIQLGFVVFASFHGGRDYTPLTSYLIFLGVIGGLVLTKIAAIQNIFPNMVVGTVPPMIDLGYNFRTMAFSGLGFPMVVYVLIIMATVFALYESIRPSDDKSSKIGSLVSCLVGLVAYFVFLHGVHVAPWISFVIAALASAGGSAALRSKPAQQWVTPVWGVRSPFDGAMLLAAILILLLVIFGQAWWLVGLVL